MTAQLDALPCNSAQEADLLIPTYKGTKTVTLLVLASAIASGVTIASRFLGWLQSWELQTFDLLMQLRPNEGIDKRILLVTITEKDVQSQSAQERGRSSLSDRSLAELIAKLEPYKPRVIGLDIYRDRAVGEGYNPLAAWMRKSDRFFNPGVNPPPEVPSIRQGFNNVLSDADEVRRFLVRLDVRGSFVASTASAIQFGDRGFFSAINLAILPLLNVNPSAFLFNLIASGRIENRSNTEISRRPERLLGLQVPEGRSLLLLGREILIDGGGLNAANGRIELAGVAGEGTVGLTVNGNNLSLSMPDSVARGNIAIANNARVNVSGKGGGFIQIQGSRVSLTKTSEITADTLGEEDGQGISIRASQLIVRDGSQISTNARENSQ